MGIVEQASVDGKGAAGAMQGTEEQAAADVDRGCRDNAVWEYGDTWWWAWSPRTSGGTPGTWSQRSPKLSMNAL